MWEQSKYEIKHEQTLSLHVWRYLPLFMNTAQYFLFFKHYRHKTHVLLNQSPSKKKWNVCIPLKMAPEALNFLIYPTNIMLQILFTGNWYWICLLIHFNEQKKSLIYPAWFSSQFKIFNVSWNEVKEYNIKESYSMFTLLTACDQLNFKQLTEKNI